MNELQLNTTIKEDEDDSISERDRAQWRN